MVWTIIAEHQTIGSAENFSRAARLAIQKPQVLHKEYAGALILYEHQHGSVTTDRESWFIDNLRSSINQNLILKTDQKWDSLVEPSSVYLQDCFEEFFKSYAHDSNTDSGHPMVFFLQYVIPKNLQHSKAIMCYLVDDLSFTCLPLLIKDGDSFRVSDGVVYRISYSNGSTSSLKLSTYDDVEKPENISSMLLSLFEKFRHYCDTELDPVIKHSLKLVNFDKYNDMYNKLKAKHAKYLMSNWCEKTDPQKYVYEDIAIAAYLILLFEDERRELGLETRQTFVDIGCGNGLLVYLLGCEGYHGTGLDIRRRKIWDWFGKDVDLQEVTLIPSDSTLFPQYDWLIGNHSDEMTPWIPVISSRSSYRSRFFVLPCCPHDFNGKFRDRKSNLSCYQAYLDYVEEITEMCGFVPERDVLKIPSTKRTCVVGRRRNYCESDESVIDSRRSEFIEFRCHRLLRSNNETSVCSDNLGFVPRPEEKVRNCTQLDRDLKMKIVDTVFRLILETNNVVNFDGKMWNKGGRLPLSTLAENFDKDTLKKLKNECGGLQTLLKNHHQVFKVVQGHVELRFGCDDVRGGKKTSSSSGATTRAHYKTSLCFFHENHPDGCWQSPDRCNFAHGLNDLREFVTDSLK